MSRLETPEEILEQLAERHEIHNERTHQGAVPVDSDPEVTLEEEETARQDRREAREQRLNEVRSGTHRSGESASGRPRRPLGGHGRDQGATS